MTNPVEIDCVTLECREGGSNKDYSIWIEKREGGYVVPFLFGPIGGTKQAANKTPVPVPLEDAKKILEKVVSEKLAKGYVIGGNVPAYSQIAGAVDSGIRPMLLTAAVEESIPRYVADDDWGAQVKLNGKRILIRIEKGQAVGINRRGLECAIPSAIQEAFLRVGIEAVLDGELVGTTYHVFDLLVRRHQGAESRDFRHKILIRRMAAVEDLVKAVGNNDVRTVPLEIGPKAKRQLVECLKEGRKEGVVFKRLDGSYLPGKVESLRKSAAVKVKFYAEGSFVVLARNDKSSVELGATSKNGSEPLTSVGNLTVPRKYASHVQPGQILRVRYLYATAGRKLYQTFLDPDADGSVVRDDLTAADCKLSQLKFQGEAEE